MVSLGELVRTAAGSLRPLVPFDPAQTITGVHVSELEDPGRYLGGGELLLTTGIPLRTRSVEAYVHRLRAPAIGAIGVGLGEGLNDVPTALVDHCRAVGIPVLAVPDGVPFLEISRAYWSIAGRGGRDEALRTMHGHTRLVQAAAGDDSIAAIVRCMADAVDGWAAWVPFDVGSRMGVLFPSSLEALLPTIRRDVERSLLRSGVEAASFISQGSTVVAYAVTDGMRTRGVLALSAGRTLTRTDRQLALTAVGLLRLSAEHATGTAGPERWFTALALRGESSAARALARVSGLEIPSEFRVLAGSPETYLFHSEQDGVPVALVSAEEEITALTGALSAPTVLEDLPYAAARAIAVHRRAPHAALVIDSDARAVRWSELLAAADPVLLRTVRAYLRHRQQTGPTARELGVHRNTVRPRIATAESLLDVTFSDPDVAAELWLALRDRDR